MVLKVQEYLRSGKTLADLSAEHAVKARVNERLGVVNLTYDQLTADVTDPIACECRALLLELGTWDVVSRSFPRFLNYGQPGAADIDWASAQVQEKYDGSLIGVYHYKGEWRCHTKQTTEAEGPVVDSQYTYRQLVEVVLERNGATWDEFTDWLHPDLFYSFELTCPENRMVVPYKGSRLILIGCWDRDTLEELPTPHFRPFRLAGDAYRVTYNKPPRGVEMLLAQFSPYDIVGRIPLPKSGIDAVVEVVNARDPERFEGVVVVDGQYRRVKVKSLAYALASKAGERLLSERSRFEAVLAERVDDLVGVLPDHVAGKLRETQSRWAALKDEVHRCYEAHRHHETPREFANAVKGYYWCKWLNDMRRGMALDDVVEKVRQKVGDYFVWKVYAQRYGLWDREEAPALGE